MYEKDLALNNLQWFLCHKTKLNQIFVLNKNDYILRRLKGYLTSLLSITDQFPNWKSLNGCVTFNGKLEKSAETIEFYVGFLY